MKEFARLPKSGLRYYSRTHVVGSNEGTEPVTKQLWKPVKRFMLSEDGPTAVEYVVVLSLIVMVAFVSIQVFGIAARDLMQDSADKMP